MEYIDIIKSKYPDVANGSAYAHAMECKYILRVGESRDMDVSSLLNSTIGMGLEKIGAVYSILSTASKHPDYYTNEDIIELWNIILSIKVPDADGWIVAIMNDGYLQANNTIVEVIREAATALSVNHARHAYRVATNIYISLLHLEVEAVKLINMTPEEELDDIEESILNIAYSAIRDNELLKKQSLQRTRNI